MAAVNIKVKRVLTSEPMHTSSFDAHLNFAQSYNITVFLRSVELELCIIIIRSTSNAHHHYNVAVNNHNESIPKIVMLNNISQC